MAKQPPKTPSEMTNDELRDRYFALQKRIGWVNKNMLWIAGAIALAGITAGGALILAGVAGATAAVGIVSTSIAAGGASLGLFSMVRDTSWEDEAMRLKSENNMRFKVAEAQKKRAAAEEARKLSEEFEAAMSALRDGRGTVKSIIVRGPLRLKSKSLFGAFAP